MADEAKRVVAFVTMLHNAVVANKADCAAMASALNDVIDAGLPGLKTLPTSAELPPKAKEIVERRGREVAENLKVCAGNSDVAAAFDRVKSIR